MKLDAQVYRDAAEYVTNKNWFIEAMTKAIAANNLPYISYFIYANKYSLLFGGLLLPDERRLALLFMAHITEDENETK